MAVKQIPLPPENTNVFSSAWGYITSIIGGLKHTNRMFIGRLTGREKPTTVQWPEEPVSYGDRFKGKHFLTLRDDGQVRCTACFLCATNCPAQCIHIEAGQHPDNDIEKFPVRFEIDILRCVFCGFCEEACPVDAIRLGPEYTMAIDAGAKLVYTKDYLAGRPELNKGIHSIKDENEKHTSVEEHVNVQREGYTAEAPHGGQHH